MSEHNAPGTAGAPDGQASPGGFRPTAVAATELGAIGRWVGLTVPGAAADVHVTGISLNSRTVERGDLYVALPGSTRHGADFAAAAIESGAVAVLTDDAGARLLALAPDISVPVLVVDEPRAVVGRLSALIYRSQATDGSSPSLFGVTGTNGKTTTTYFVKSLLQALGKRTGLIGTIEIVAGGDPIPSLLTTPESTDVHALLALMRERGLDAASMEVSSHAVSFRRVDGVVFDVVGFTNLTQDHLDLHGTMEDYFRTKAELFTEWRARAAVVTVDDEWGRRLAAEAGLPVTTLSTLPVGAGDGRSPSAAPSGCADWTVTEPRPRGLGTEFTLRGSTGVARRVHTGLPGSVNVSHAALALALVQGWSFEVRLEGLGHFPPRGEPRVLWVGIEKNPDLKSLKRRIDRALADIGLPPETRKFAPHVTLARIRGPLSHDRLATYLMRHSLYRSERFPVSDFHLYSSWLKSYGAEHQIEASYELVPGLDQKPGRGRDDERA